MSTPTPITDAEQNKLKPDGESFTVWAARGWECSRSLEIKLTEVRNEHNQIMREINAILDGAEMAVGNEHRTYTLIERVQNLVAVKDYFVRMTDKARSELVATKSTQ